MASCECVTACRARDHGSSRFATIGRTVSMASANAAVTTAATAGAIHEERKKERKKEKCPTSTLRMTPRWWREYHINGTRAKKRPFDPTCQTHHGKVARVVGELQASNLSWTTWQPGRGQAGGLLPKQYQHNKGLNNSKDHKDIASGRMVDSDRFMRLLNDQPELVRKLI
jgi:hypothetical protein